MKRPESPLRRALVAKGVVKATGQPKKPSAAVRAAVDSLNAIKPITRKPA